MSNTTFDMKIDILHALSDFLDAYDNHAEMVVTEAIANAIDVGATEIQIKMKTGLDDERTISFHNNGPAMTKKQFDDYHVIARSSKSKGKGIGFAGIGAKVYLAAWDHTKIHTETTDGRSSFASEMFVRDERLKATLLNPTLTKKGTLYSVLLKDEDYAYLEKNIHDTILDVFNPALSGGLRITLNGKKILPWIPKYEIRKNITVFLKHKKFKVNIMVTDDDIDERKTYMNYHVSGKVITTKKPEWTHDVRPEYSRKILVYVDAMAISDHLNLNKTGFKMGSSHTTSPLFKEVDRRVYDILNKKGCIGNQTLQKFERTTLTRFFERLFKDPKYAFLNPGARDGRGPGQGNGSEGIKELERDVEPEKLEAERKKNPERETEKEPPKEAGNSKKKKQGGGSFSIGFVQRPDDKREGWLDPSTNKIVINLDHPLFIKYEKNTSARNQRIGAILTSVLIKNAASRKEMSPADAFDLQSELLTMAKDEMW